MTIWFQKYTLDEISARGKGTMLEHLGIVFTKVTEDSLIATLPVDHRTKQPIGLLHGGASVVLAETIGSTAANLCVDPKKFYCVGLDINANHLRAVREGTVTGTAKPLHLGKTTHVWEIKITDESEKLVCISRLTMAVLIKTR
ncbi:MAG: esterase [Deltaproteobacteria bacterium RIFCSPLOWO2_02_FULL_44_10]|nr:MAG: esterase [Deltaproteobacteria bacterium RIFCSPLOWO2_02_FULL_44_10]